MRRRNMQIRMFSTTVKVHMTSANKINKSASWLYLYFRGSKRPFSRNHFKVALSAAHAKNSHLVTSLQRSCQQVVIALLVPSCQQVWNNLLTICNNLVESSDLLQVHVRHMHDINILLQPCVVNLVTSLL